MTDKIYNIAERMADTASSALVKMEGIKPTAKLFGVPEHYIRTLVKEGKIKAVRVSNSSNAKILVNVQSVNDYFNSSYINVSEPEVNGSNGIKPIPVNLSGTDLL